MGTESTIAVLIPCFNEEGTIGRVLQDFRAELPNARLIVVDNCCTDQTVEVAHRYGAEILKEPRQGKGFAVEGMLRCVRADYFVMVDGDNTYPAEKVHDLLRPVVAGDADMAVGARLSDYTSKSFRPLHVTGNGLVRWSINIIFGTHLTDILSGFRAFNGRIAQCVPIVSSGFEIETEMTVQMLYYRLKIVEVQVPYRERPQGSVSKLHTLRDGVRIVWKIFTLFRSCKPLSFFGGMGLILFLLGLTAGTFPIHEFVASGYTEVRRVPLAILATGLMILAFSSTFLGVMLHSINYRILELHNVITRQRGDGHGSSEGRR
jgi:glycosyltransferase involved in cell wall biosynthesis